MFSLAYSVLCFQAVFGVVSGTSTGLTADGEPRVKEISLEVVTPSTGRRLKEAPLSSHIQLRVHFEAGKNHWGISLYDCKAVSEADSLQLTDSRGCPALRSPMGCMAEENGTVISPVFQLSSLGAAGDVTITCSWETCSVPHHPKCIDRCSFFTGHTMKRPGQQRQRRHERGEAPLHTVSTTIRVLPSLTRRSHHHGAASSSHHGHHGNGNSGHEAAVMTDSNPLLYLNPITCSLFLLFLSVFLGLYLYFVRSVGRTVHDIKREIESQRSRDKFLIR